ncbi:hypothetical protein D3C71_1317800 [compost metagenome]
MRLRRQRRTVGLRQIQTPADDLAACQCLVRTVGWQPADAAGGHCPLTLTGFQRHHAMGQQVDLSAGMLVPGRQVFFFMPKSLALQDHNGWPICSIKSPSVVIMPCSVRFMISTSFNSGDRP